MKKVHKQVKIKRCGSKVKDPKKQNKFKSIIENIGISYPMHTTEIPILTVAKCTSLHYVYTEDCKILVITI